MERIRISNCIEYIQPNVIKNPLCCSGVIVSSKPRIFIDTNMGMEDSMTLLAQEPPDIAIISHYHADHSSWARTALFVCNPTLFVPEGEEDRLQSLDVYVDSMVPFEEMKPVVKTFYEDKLGYQEIRNFDFHYHKKVFTCRDTILKGIKSPGHSPSHTCFYFPDEKILFCGDMGIGIVGPYYAFKDSNLRSLVESILRLKRFKVEALMTAHEGLVTSNIEQAWNNGLKVVLTQERIIRQGLDQGKNKQDIVNSGICYRCSDKNDQQTKLNRMWDSVIFDQHYAILLEGGLSRIFPELRDIEL
jgi:hydroxyacylglutathione hydrolase